MPVTARKQVYVVCDFITNESILMVTVSNTLGVANFGGQRFKNGREVKQL
jgi:hypothetical protein